MLFRFYRLGYSITVKDQPYSRHPNPINRDEYRAVVNFLGLGVNSKHRLQKLVRKIGQYITVMYL